MAQDTPAREPDENEHRTDFGQPIEVGPGVAGEKAVGGVAPSPQRKTILIVDDVAVMRLRLRPQLEEAGYRVLEAEDGEKALEVIQNEPLIDMVITDVSMPVMDGLELIRKLRLELNHLHLPIIVCTARGEISVVRKAKLLGVQGFLVKPISKPTLLGAIRREIG
jgi:two-component system, chemotaxis family, chemotaxis protein CheY